VRILDLVASGKNHKHRWPIGDAVFPQWVDYRVATPNGEYVVRIGFADYDAYGRDRKRVIVFRGQDPLVEFVGADDFEQTGEVLSLIKFASADGPGERNCRYPGEAVPERYAAFNVVGFKTHQRPTFSQRLGCRSQRR
jgi:hypothetical protein